LLSPAWRERRAAEMRQKIAERAATGATAYSIAKELGVDRKSAAKWMGATIVAGEVVAGQDMCRGP
jgi:hypothetical protein